MKFSGERLVVQLLIIYPYWWPKVVVALLYAQVGAFFLNKYTQFEWRPGVVKNEQGSLHQSRRVRRVRKLVEPTRIRLGS